MLLFFRLLITIFKLGLGNTGLRGKWPTVALLTPVLIGITATSGLLVSEITQAASSIDEVVVTARRKEENLQEVPIAITAFSDEFLKENNIAQLNDMRTHAPSLGIGPAGNSTNVPIVSLRGQRPSEVLITLDAAVPLYFADIPLTPTHGTNLAMYDLGNVQILKGPQGTLFGKNSTGGAILFSPKKPGDTFGGYIETKVGDYSLFGLEGAVDLPISNTIRMRLAGKTLDRDGYQKNVADNALRGQDYWDEHSRGLRLSLDIDLSDRLNNLLVLDWGENDMRAVVPTPVAFNPSPYDGNRLSNGGAQQACPYCMNVSKFYNSSQFAAQGANNYGLLYDAIKDQAGRDWTRIKTDQDAQESLENTLIANTTTFEINDAVSIKNILGYRHLSYEYHADIDGTALGLFGTRVNGGPFAAGSTFGNLTGKLLGLVTYDDEYPKGSVNADQYSDEFQVLTKGFDDRLDLIVGASYFTTDAREDKPNQLSSIDSELRRDRGEVGNTAYGLFTEGTFKFTDWYALTAGVRESWDRREMTVSHTTKSTEACNVLSGGDTSTALPDNACFRKVSENFSEPTWRIINTFTPREGMMFYVSGATGYRTGGFNMRGNSANTLKPFDEETVLTFELGSKLDWQFDSGVVVRTNAALYTQDYKDLQKTTSCQTCSSFATETINVGKATINGAELELSVIPFEGLEFNLGYSYVDAEYDEFTTVVTASDPLTGLTASEVQDISHRDFTYIPESSVTASLRYTLPLDSNLGEISFLVSYYAQDEMLLDDKTDGYNIVAGALDGYNPATNPPVDNAMLNAAMTARSYTIWDYRIDWTNILMSQFDVAVWVKNANDEKYVTGGLNVLGSLGYAAEVYGAPRTFGASLTYRF